MFRSKTITRFFTISLLVVFASGCSSQSKLRSAYDDSIDFSQYKTYNYIDGAGPNSDNYQSLFSQYMVKAIDKEMQARGYTMSDAPDLLVNFNANLQDKTKVTTSPSMYGGSYYGYRRGYYDPWAGYGYGTDTHVSQYTEGTFNIDLIDPVRKQLVWEAIGVGRINDDTFENLEQKVAEGVPRYFALYPFRAGDGTPREAE
ncbi:MAG: DUF4136 domain-containing protein [Woeseiaceae bacterium]